MEDIFVWDSKIIKNAKTTLSSVFSEKRILWIEDFITALKPILRLYRTNVEPQKLLQSSPEDEILYVLDKQKTLTLKSITSNIDDNTSYLGYCTHIFDTLKGLEKKLNDLYTHIFAEIRIFGQFSPQSNQKDYLKAILYDKCNQSDITIALCENYEYLIKFDTPAVNRRKRTSLISVFGSGETQDSTGDKVRILANHNLDNIDELFRGHQSTNKNLKEFITLVNKNTNISDLKIAGLSDLVSLLVRQNLFLQHERNLEAQRTDLQNVLQSVTGDLSNFAWSFDSTLNKLLKHMVSDNPTCTITADAQNQFTCTQQGFVQKAELLKIHTKNHLKHYEFLPAFRLICTDRADGSHYVFNEQIHHIDPLDENSLITSEGIKIDKRCLTNGYSKLNTCQDFYNNLRPNVNFVALYGSVIFTIRDKIYFQSNKGAKIVVDGATSDIVQPIALQSSKLPITLIFEGATYTLTHNEFEAQTYENVHVNKLIQGELDFVLGAFHESKIIPAKDPHQKSIEQFQAVLADASKLWNSSKVFRDATISISSIVTLIIIVGIILLIMCCCRNNCCRSASFNPPKVERRKKPKVVDSDDSDHYDKDMEKQPMHKKIKKLSRR